MVGGDDYNSSPFNLATQGQRQPGSSFKPFVLAEALKQRHLPRLHVVVARSDFDVPQARARASPSTTTATRTSGVTHAGQRDDVLRQLGLRRRSASRSGTKKIARLARRMGIRTPVSHNWAMTLGGLKQGVTPLDMAHAYQTFADGRQAGLRHAQPRREQRPSRPRRARSASRRSPRARSGKPAVELPNGDDAVNRKQTRRCSTARRQRRSRTILAEASSQNGTGKRARRSPASRSPARPARPRTTATPGSSAGRPSYTVAVWVGYPDKFQPMKTEFQGEPVAGGTFPAGDLADVHGVADQDRPAARSSRSGDAETADADPGRDRRAGRRSHAPPRPRRDAARPTAPQDQRRRHRRRATTAEAAPSPTPKRRPPPQPAEPAPRPPHRAADAGATPPSGAGTGAAAPHRRAATASATPRRAQRVAQPRRPRPRHERMPARAEPPRQLGRLGDPDPRPATISTAPSPAAAARSRSAREQVGAVEVELDVERLGELARAVAEVLARGAPRRSRIALEPVERLQRADQHRGADALGLADRVEQRVDAVGAVDVGAAGRRRTGRACGR